MVEYDSEEEGYLPSPPVERVRMWKYLDKVERVDEEEMFDFELRRKRIWKLRYRERKLHLRNRDNCDDEYVMVDRLYLMMAESIQRNLRKIERLTEACNMHVDDINRLCEAYASMDCDVGELNLNCLM